MPRQHASQYTPAIESLERRAVLAAEALTPNCPPPEVEVSVTSLTVSSPIIAADAPWMTYAAQCQSGTLVMRVLVTPTADGQENPDAKVNLLQARFNGPSPSSPGASPPSTPVEPQVEGVVFPGEGVPTLPTDTWPKPLDTFESYKPPADAGPQEFFVVFQSDSDVLLGSLCFFLSLASDPSFQNAGGIPGATTDTGTDTGGTSTSGGLDAGGLSGLAAMAAFAMLAGMGQQQKGLTVSLQNDTGSSDSDCLTKDGRLQVDAPTGAKVEYSTDGGRTWKSSFRAREGKNDMQVRSTDTSGGQSQASQMGFSFTLDTRPPAAPQVALQADTGRSATDRITRVSDLVVRNREANSTLEYSVNGGDWTPAYSPVEGRNRVLVRQIDTAGNASRPSKPFVFRLDTQVSDVAVVAAAQSAQQAASGTSRRPRFTGVEAGAVLHYSTDGAETWSNRTPPAAFRGWVVVRQTDVAGNMSSPTTYMG